MKSNIFDDYSISKLIATFSLPAILSLILEMMTSVVDTSFAGHIGSQSESALSAMGLLSPLLATFVALQTLFATSTAIMISKDLGSGDQLRLNKYFQSGFVMTCVVSVVTSGTTWILMEPLLTMLGAKGEVWMLAKDYLTIILLSNILSAIGYTLTSVIRAFGYPKAEAIIITIAVAINIVCNAILTFGFQLGVVGIALGTFISELVCAIISIVYLVKHRIWFSTNKISLKEHGWMSFQLFKIGFAQTAIQLLAGVSAFIVNHQLISIGGHSQIAIWNIANKVYMLVLMPIIGITQAVQTILAYFEGKGELLKKNITVKKTMLYSIVYGIGITIVMYMFGNVILHLFTSDKTMLMSTQHVVKVIFLTFPLLGITYTIMTLLQVTGREIHAVLLGLTRQVIVIVPLVLLLPIIFSTENVYNISPAFSIFLSIPLADILTLSIAIFFYRKTLEK
ncbi:MATE family efflux transporter [Lysinibacillus mangiferihumi]|uniref:Probable multidrug resistance protein NorM n=1 Tax=Lysinibacillus mangiferihumi TaxID=1130819 RepID=A0A4U2Y2D7_9BACI|nr:MATE family efflux transporter [Lysinibacillus mangiferihumi]TKI53271.1 MATE family efflux transporter [Lysinibacillus mangiferihumi]